MTSYSSNAMFVIRRLAQSRSNTTCDLLSINAFTLLLFTFLVLCVTACSGGTDADDLSDSNIGRSTPNVENKKTPTNNHTTIESTKSMTSEQATTSIIGTTSMSPPTDLGLFFPKQKPGGSLEAFMEALTRGEIVTEKRCVILRHPDGSKDLLVWPSGFELSANRDELNILDEEDEFVARIGDEVEMSGGQVTALEAGEAYEELRRELRIPETCPESLWMVGAEVRII